MPSIVSITSEDGSMPTPESKRSNLTQSTTDYALKTQRVEHFLDSIKNLITRFAK